MSNSISDSVILVTGGYDHTIKIWDVLFTTCFLTIPFPDSQVNSLAINRDKRCLAAGGCPAVKIFDISSTKLDPIISFEGHDGNVKSIGFQRDSRWLFTAGEDGILKIWDTRTSKCQRQFGKKKDGGINQAILHPNQAEIIYVTSNGFLRTWDLSSNTCTHNLLVDRDSLQSISISIDASVLIASSYSGMVYQWNLKMYQGGFPQEPTLSFKAQDKYQTRSILSPDGKYNVEIVIFRTLSTLSSDKNVRIWNIETHQLACTLTGHQGWVWDGVFSIDSAYFISVSSDQSARLWDLSSGLTIKEYTGHSKGIVSVALNDIPDL